MMRKTITLLAACMVTIMAMAQQLPQFTSSDYDGWTYNNPNIAINTSNIAMGKIALYVSSTGQILTLTSPLFDCQGMDSITADVMWKTLNFSDSNFNPARATLTMAIDDELGNPIDSVTCITPAIASTHYLTLTVPVKDGLTTARLRFLSWTANVVSFGSIMRVLLTAVTSPQGGDDVLTGDVDNNGKVDIADVTALIDHLLGSTASINTEAADVDNDGNISISDVTALIDKLLSGE